MPCAALSARLKAERERLGLSQAEFGSVVGAAKRTVIRWEAGESYPDACELLQLREAGVRLEYVLGPPALGTSDVSVSFDYLSDLERWFIDRLRLMDGKLRDALVVIAQDAVR